MSCQGSEASESHQAPQHLIDRVELSEGISRNLASLEPELKLFNDGAKTGLQFLSFFGPIDIVAVDRMGHPVVIQVEPGLASRLTLAELLGRMSFVDEKLGLGRSRGIIVAKEFEGYLTSAAERVPDVTLMKYQLEVSMKRVTTAPSVEPATEGGPPKGFA